MIPGRPDNEQLWALLSAKLANEADETQLKAMEHWITENPWFKPVLDCCTVLWNSAEVTNTDAPSVDDAFISHLQKIKLLQSKAGVKNQLAITSKEHELPHNNNEY